MLYLIKCVILPIYLYNLFPVVVEEPEFTDVIENVTVPAGRNVKLACSVKNLGSYKVSTIGCNQTSHYNEHYEAH